MFDFKKVLEKIKSLDNNKISCKKIYTGIDLNTINNTENRRFWSKLYKQTLGFVKRRIFSNDYNE